MTDQCGFRIELNQESNDYEVIDPEGRTVIVCKSELAAAQYVTILAQAFRLGYRRGYHAAEASNE